MASERIDEKAIFNCARVIAAEVDREAYLQQACGDDPEAIHRLRELLRVYDQEKSFLESPPVVGNATMDQIPLQCPGATVGPYKLIEQIGEGGMGTVYMAQQTEPVKRAVALKIIKAGMDTRQVIARFEAERQALALMDHPSIAKVLDAGTTGGEAGSVSPGRPFFVMELVKGVSITRYCDEHRLTPRERLELFIPVCQAVQHAHQKGIIHRDLKPSNILVAQYDGRPVPKVIDFGVAKAAGQPLTDKTLMTGFGSLIGTLEYMSPEQAEINQLDIDTRSDIYSLGVVLYELLTGSTPLDRKRLTQAAFNEMLRIIREEEPPRPSTRLSDSTDSLASISAQRHMEPAKLTRAVRGELDWIVMKALEKDRSRRYETANGFAADLQRYLDDDPVLACPPSAWYRFRKFARRSKSTLVVTAGVLLALAGMAGGIGWGLRDRASREEALDQVVDRTLKETGPLIQQEKWHEALGAVERADQLLAAAGRMERPRRLMELRTELSMADRLERIYEHPKPELPVVASSEGVTGPTHPERQGSTEQDFFMGRQADAEYARAFRDFGVAIDSLAPAEAAAQIARHGIFPALVKALDEWGPLRRRARGLNDPGWKTLVLIARLADPDPWRNRCRGILLRRDRTAMEELAATVPIDQVPVRTLWLLGMTLRDVGAPDEAISLLRRAQHQFPSDLWLNDALGDLSWGAVRPPRTEDALRFYSIALALRPTRPELHYVVGDILRYKNDVEGAIREYQAALELDPKLVIAHISLGNALRTKNLLGPAIAEFRKAIELDPKRANAHMNLGVALKDMDQLDDAIAEFKKAIDLDPKFEPAHDNLGVALKAKNQLDEAIAEFRKAIDLEPKCATAHTNLGVVLKDKNRLEEAIVEHRKAIDLDPRFAMARYNLGVALRAKGQSVEGIAEYRKSIDLDPKFAPAHNNLGNALRDTNQLDEAIAEYRKLVELEPKLAMAHYDLGRVLQAKNQVDEAIAEYRKAIGLDPKLANAHNNLGLALGAKNQWDEAIAEYKKAIDLDPKDAGAHFNLGNALGAKKQWDDAIAEFRKAIDLDPKRADVHNNLGVALKAKNQWDEAIAEYKRAIDLDPKLANAHFNLGNALMATNQLDEASAQYRKVIDLQSDNYAEANCGLAGILQSHGQLSAALDFYQRGHASGSKRKNWRYPSAQWVANAERLVRLEGKLADVLEGKATAADSSERLGLVEVCRLKRRHVAAAQLYAAASPADPERADDLKAGHRYNAACSAALAAAGQGTDTDKLDDQQRRRLRQQALAWLRADLEQWARQPEAGKPEDRRVVQTALEHWQRDTDLASVRDPAPLEKLAAEERDAWRKLWADAAELLKKARDAKG